MWNKIGSWGWTLGQVVGSCFSNKKEEAKVENKELKRRMRVIKRKRRDISGEKGYVYKL